MPPPGLPLGVRLDRRLLPQRQQSCPTCFTITVSLSLPSAARSCSSTTPSTTRYARATRKRDISPFANKCFASLASPERRGELCFHSLWHVFQTYVNNLNVAMEKLADAQAKGDVTAVVQLQQAIKFNGGGHLNHSIFWQNLAPPSKGGGEEPASGPLADLVTNQFGSFNEMKDKLSAATVAVQVGRLSITRFISSAREEGAQ